MAKDSFVVFAEMEKQVDRLNDEQAGQLFRAMFVYNRGEEPSFSDPMVGLAFDFVRPVMDRNQAKWEARAASSRENGKKGGRPKKTEAAPTETHRTQQVLEKPRKPVNVRVPVPVPVHVPVHESAGATPPTRARDESKPDPQSQKVQWAENVAMTNEEHEKLVEAHGPADTALMIEHLSDYKAATGKKYRDDYRAILSWVVSWMQDRRPMTGGLQRANRAPTPADRAHIPQEEKECEILENERWMREYLDKAKEKRNEQTAAEGDCSEEKTKNGIR